MIDLMRNLRYTHYPYNSLQIKYKV